MNKNIFILHPLFIVLAIFMCVFVNAFYFICFLSAVFIHEYAHYIVAKKIGVGLKNFCLLPYGAQLSLSSSNLNYKDDIKIAISGPLANIFVGILTICLWWIYPESYAYTDIFVYSNISLAIFNFLPLLPLDGSRILLALSSKYKKRSICYKVLCILNIISSILLFILFIISLFYSPNFSFGIMSFFILLGAFDDKELYSYESILTLQSKVLSKNKPMPLKVFCITQDSDKMCIHKILNQNYYTALLVFDENNKVKKVIMQNEFENIFLKSENNEKCN